MRTTRIVFNLGISSRTETGTHTHTRKNEGVRDSILLILFSGWLVVRSPYLPDNECIEWQ